MTTHADRATGAIDLTLMYAAHDAFRRDLSRLAAAVERTDACAEGSAFRTGWETFEKFLSIHHRAEDSHLWPVLRPKVASDVDRVRLMDEMDAEHAVLDPLLEGIGSALAGQRREEVAALLVQVTEKLTVHLDHEEKDTLPLVQEVMTPAEYDAFAQEQRRLLGLKGGSVFFPWALDGASEETARAALGVLPPPVRLIYRAVWKPRYERRTRQFVALSTS